MFNYTPYFENGVLKKRPYLKKEWCVQAIGNPLKWELQENERVRLWGKIENADGKFLRVITLIDRTTIHKAFVDRDFKL